MSESNIQEPSVITTEKAPRVQVPERIWPIGLAVAAIAIYVAYFLIFYSSVSFGLWGIFQNIDTYMLISIIITFLAPLLYVIGVVFMYLERRAGRSERLRMSKLGGITLIIAGVVGATYFALYIEEVFRYSGNLYYSAYGTAQMILMLVGAIGSLVGGYYALRRKSFKVAMLAGGLSVMSGVYMWPLALVPLALGVKDFEAVQEMVKQ